MFRRADVKYPNGRWNIWLIHHRRKQSTILAAFYFNVAREHCRITRFVTGNSDIRAIQRLFLTAELGYILDMCIFRYHGHQHRGRSMAVMMDGEHTMVCCDLDLVVENMCETAQYMLYCTLAIDYKATRRRCILLE